MSDWWAEANYPGEKSDKRAKCPVVSAGNDLYMTVPDATVTTEDDLEEKLREGELGIGELQRNAIHILGFLLKSPALLHLNGRIAEEELGEMNRKKDAEIAPSDIVYYYSDASGNVTLPSDVLHPKAGNADVVGLCMERYGIFSVHVSMKSDLGALAQLPISVSLDGALKAVISVKGSEGKDIEASADIGFVYGNNHFLKLYYGADGMQISKVVISLDRALTLDEFIKEMD